MSANNLVLFILCVLVSSSRCSDELSEGSHCVTQGLKGTCVDLFKCDSAALTYLYREAGFVTDSFPEMPEICSQHNNKLIVCCTDCDTANSTFRSSAVAPGGIITDTKGSVARAKCYEYFKRLPYPCRGQGHVNIRKNWDEEKKCHTSHHIVLGGFAVGGRDAQKWEFPHMALLGYGFDVESAQWLCGGTVISERFILTAAHCSSTPRLGSIKYAALGLLKRSDPKENWKVYNIKDILIHPGYMAPSKYHDIALLKTDTEIHFGKDLLPACLDIFSHGPLQAEASGWGRLGHREGLADHLQTVHLDKFNASECAEIYQPHRHLKHGYDHDTQMCFGSNKRIVDTCEGDSGGPLQVNQDKCLYTVAGVTSYGKDCGFLGSAGMYTRVSYYVPWIESIVWPGETNDYE